MNSKLIALVLLAEFVPSNGVQVLYPGHDCPQYETKVACSNGAEPKIERRSDGSYLICDARRKP